MKRFGTTDTNEITAFADAYTAAVEVRDAAQADLNTKSATADAYYNTLTTNEQAILLEVRRFAPAAFDIPSADAALRSCALRRREVSDDEARADPVRDEPPLEPHPELAALSMVAGAGFGNAHARSTRSCSAG